MEKDDEVKGSGNSYTTEFRQYDPRLGRWLSIDPKATVFPDVSPYAFSLNNPIVLNDPKGDCPPGVNCEDVVDNPTISTGNKGLQSNRFGRVIRTRLDGSTYYHTGIDILAKKGTQLRSVMAGEVVSVYNSNSLGNTVVIKTKLEDGSYVWIQYSHLDKASVKNKQKVKAGEVFGLAGNTGNATNIPVKDHHVHIEASLDGVFYGGKNRVDPEQFFKTKFDDNGRSIPGKSETEHFIEYVDNYLIQDNFNSFIQDEIYKTIIESYKVVDYDETEDFIGPPKPPTSG